MELEFENVKYDIKYPAKILLQNKPGRRCNTPIHWHRCAELLYMVDGRINVNTRNGHYLLKTDEMYFINGEVVHGTGSLNDEEKINYLVVLLSLDPLRKYTDNIDNLHFDLMNNTSAMEKVKNDLSLIAELFKAKEKYFELSVNALLFDIYYILLSECLTDKKSYAENKDDSFNYAKKAIEYISTHYTESITLNDVAAFVGLSPSYFSRYFKSITKSTFIQYLSGVRLENALRDITENRESVTNAAFNNGFANIKSLIRMCKRVYGCTPTQYNQRFLEDFTAK